MFLSNRLIRHTRPLRHCRLDGYYCMLKWYCMPDYYDMLDCYCILDSFCILDCRCTPASIKVDPKSTKIKRLVLALRVIPRHFKPTRSYRATSSVFLWGSGTSTLSKKDPKRKHVCESHLSVVCFPCRHGPNGRWGIRFAPRTTCRTSRTTSRTSRSTSRTSFRVVLRMQRAKWTKHGKNSKFKKITVPSLLMPRYAGTKRSNETHTCECVKRVFYLFFSERGAYWTVTV